MSKTLAKLRIKLATLGCFEWEPLIKDSFHMLIRPGPTACLFKSMICFDQVFYKNEYNQYYFLVAVVVQHHPSFFAVTCLP